MSVEFHELTPDEPSRFYSVLEAYPILGVLHSVAGELYSVPSDTGKVALRKDEACTLIAIKDRIEKGETITHVPFTDKVLFEDDRNDRKTFCIEHLKGTVIKKFGPFSAFGGFAQWNKSRARANCELKIVDFYKDGAQKSPVLVWSL